MSASESKTAKAIRLLKEQPFEFVDHGEYRSALPRNFEPKNGDNHWGKATAVMAVLRAKPGTWMWKADTIRALGRLSANTVKDGIRKLKQEGWVHHVHVYDENRKNLTVFTIAFNSPIPEHQRAAESRFTMLYTDRGWLFGYRKEGKYTLHDGVSKKRQTMSAHPPHGHNSSIEEPPNPQGGIKISLSKTEPETPSPQTTRELDPTPPVEEVEHREALTRKLEDLGKKRDDSEEDALAYEEFVTQQIIPQLIIPRPTFVNGKPKSRNTTVTLYWLKNSLLGMILLRMSSSPGWDAGTARKFVSHADDDKVHAEDLRIVLFAFDWTRDRRSRRTLEKMTERRPGKDPNTGQSLAPGWERFVASARSDYRRGILGQVLEQRNRLFPQNEEDMEVCHDLNRRVVDTMRDICTGKLLPDQKNLRHFGLRSPDALALLLSRCRRSEETQKLVDESKVKLETYLATDYAGILIYRSNYHLIPETMGLTLEGIKHRHAERVRMIIRRLDCHGIPTDGVQPLI